MLNCTVHFLECICSFVLKFHILFQENGASGETQDDVRGASCAPGAENCCSIDLYSDEIMSFEEQLQCALMLSSELHESAENNSNPFAFLDEVNQESIGSLENEQLQLVMAMSLEEHQVAQRREEQRQQTGNPSFGSGRDRQDWWQLEREREEVRKERERLEKEKEEWRRKVEKEKNRERARQTIRDLTKCLETDDCCGDDSDDEYCKEKECCSEDEDCEEECCSEDEDCLENKCCSDEEEEDKGSCSKSNSNASEDTGDTVIEAAGVDPALSMTDEARLRAIVLEEEKRERRLRREKRRMRKYEEDLQLATALSLSVSLSDVYFTASLDFFS